MKCYKDKSEAVGICKNCNKGLCTECAIDIGNGIACKNSCEEAVKLVNELINKNKGAYKKNSSVFYKGAAINGLFGLFFISYPFFLDYFFPFSLDPCLKSYMIPLGIIFFIGMIFSIYMGKTWNEKEKS